MASSGLYKGSRLKSMENISELSDILDISLLIIFSILEDTSHSILISSISSPDPMLFVGTYDDLSGIQLTCYTPTTTSTYTGHVECSPSRIILTSAADEICIRHSGSVLCGVSLLLSGIWDGRVISPQNKITEWPCFPLEFLPSDDHPTSLIVKSRLLSEGEEVNLDGLFDLASARLRLIGRSTAATMTLNASFHSGVMEFSGRGLHSIHLKKVFPKKLELIAKANNIFDAAIDQLRRNDVSTRIPNVRSTRSLPYLRRPFELASEENETQEMPTIFHSREALRKQDIMSALIGKWTGLSIGIDSAIVTESLSISGCNIAGDVNYLVGASTSERQGHRYDFDVRINTVNKSITVFEGSEVQIQMIKRPKDSLAAETMYSCILIEIQSSDIEDFLSGNNLWEPSCNYSEKGVLCIMSLDCQKMRLTKVDDMSQENYPSTTDIETPTVPINKTSSLLAPISNILCRVADEIKDQVSVKSQDTLRNLIQNIHDDDESLQQYSNLASTLCQILPEERCSLVKCGKETDSDICRICYTAPIDCVFLPCGHLAVCTDCAKKLEFCPYDRQQIRRLQPVFRV